MLRLFMDHNLFWSANIEECENLNYSIYSLKTKQQIDEPGQMDFTIMRNHPMRKKIIPKRSVFLLARDNTVLFVGKVSTATLNFDYSMSIVVEELPCALKDCYIRNRDTTEDDHTYKELYPTLQKILSDFVANADLNASWPGYAFSRFRVIGGVGRGYDASIEDHEYDIDGKSLYDVLYSEVIGKLGGFFRMHVSGKYSPTWKVFDVTKQPILEYINDVSDYNLYVNNGLIYEYESVDDSDYEIYAGDVEIGIDETPVDLSEEIIWFTDDSEYGVPGDEDGPYGGAG